MLISYVLAVQYSARVATGTAKPFGVLTKGREQMGITLEDVLEELREFVNNVQYYGQVRDLDIKHIEESLKEVEQLLRETE